MVWTYKSVVVVVVGLSEVSSNEATWDVEVWRGAHDPCRSPNRQLFDVISSLTVAGSRWGNYIEKREERKRNKILQ